MITKNKWKKYLKNLQLPEYNIHTEYLDFDWKRNERGGILERVRDKCVSNDDYHGRIILSRDDFVLFQVEIIEFHKNVRKIKLKIIFNNTDISYPGWIEYVYLNAFQRNKIISFRTFIKIIKRFLFIFSERKKYSKDKSNFRQDFLILKKRIQKSILVDSLKIKN